jgi:drug/metabolite transporter (DMT)-like permease
MPSAQTLKRNGIRAALLSALLLGTTPVLGKIAYADGMDPYSLTAIRTLVAASLLWVFYLSSKKNRKFIYIYPAGLLISATAGALNGASSLLYYNGLTTIDAGVGQMLYSLYPLFVVMIRRLDGQRVSNWTKVRLGLALLAVILLITPHGGQVDWNGAALMLGAGLMYHAFAVSQRVLVRNAGADRGLYVLTMTAVVCAAYILHGPTAVPLAGLPPDDAGGICMLSRLLCSWE